jgi:signal peptidase I
MQDEHFSIHIHLLLSFLKALTKSLFSIACFLFILKFFIVSFDQVAGNSMVPTFKTNNLFLTNKLSYIWRNPQRGDVVQVIEPAKNTFVIKRIVGLPNETITFKEGSVFINSNKIEESYLRKDTPTLYNRSAETTTIEIPPNHYFVLGDNRMFSIDSRNYGIVDRLNITGLVTAQFDPLLKKITRLDY